jgi:hypothetical protein
MNRCPLSNEHRLRIGATALGMPLETYRAKIEAGLKHCFACQSWKPRASAFHRRASAADGLNNECRDCVLPRARATMARLHRRRALAAS